MQATKFSRSLHTRTQQSSRTSWCPSSNFISTSLLTVPVCVFRRGGRAVLWDHSGSLHLQQPLPWISGSDQTGKKIKSYLRFQLWLIHLADQKQTKWLVNDIMYRFHSVWIKGGQPYWIQNSGLFRFLRLSDMKLTWGSVSDDVVGREIEKSNFRGVMKCTIMSPLSPIGVLVHSELAVRKSDWLVRIHRT